MPAPHHPLILLGVGAGVAAAILLRRRFRRRRRPHLVEIDPEHHGPPPLPLASPEEVGLSSERLRHISLWSDGWTDAGKLPGLITLVARRGKLCYLHCSGVADVETGQPIAQNTIVRLYSLSKPLVSVCAMVLYERGFFQLDEPISYHLPSFANPTVLLPSGEVRRTAPRCFVRSSVSRLCTQRPNPRPRRWCRPGER